MNSQYRTLMERMMGWTGCFFETGFVLNRIKGFKEIQDEQPIQTGIKLIYGICCDLKFVKQG